MEGKSITLAIAEYSEYPGPRYCDQGDCSGEDFYHTKLNPTFALAILKEAKLTIILDNTAGYASSFLDEAFGNLVYDFTLQKVKENLTIISKEEPDWKAMIINEVFVDWEERRINSTHPKKTIKHPDWYRFSNGQMEKKKWL